MQTSQRDPSNFIFNDEELLKIEEHMKNVTPSLIDMDENLAINHIRIPSQNYALVTIVSSQNTTQTGEKTIIKIRGVFETLEEANNHAARIVKHDSTFDILVVSMHEWLMIPPNMDKIKDQQYMDEDLNGFISEYRKTQERARLEFDMRKEGLKQNTHSSLTEVEKKEEL
jgi:hypothetical protein